jgi:hypothetical protein
MKIRRDISSIPLRTAEETWGTIRQLVTGPGSIEAEQFDAAASIMASLTTDESFRDEPLILLGMSHRLVIYLQYGADALEAGDAVDSLNWNPTSGDWTLYVPCAEEQFDWVKKALTSRASRFVLLKPGVTVPDEDEETAKSENVEINWTVFEK